MVRAPCAVCGAEEAPFKCDRCFGVRYCGPECFESDTCLKKVAYHRSTAALCEAPREANGVEEFLGLRVAGLEAEVARLTTAAASAASEEADAPPTSAARWLEKLTIGAIAALLMTPGGCYDGELVLQVLAYEGEKFNGADVYSVSDGTFFGYALVSPLLADDMKKTVDPNAIVKLIGSGVPPEAVPGLRFIVFERFELVERGAVVGERLGAPVEHEFVQKLVQLAAEAKAKKDAKAPKPKTQPPPAAPKPKKPPATFAVDEAYPKEKVLRLHDAATSARLVVPSAKEQRKLFQRRNVVLREVAENEFRHWRAGEPSVVPASLFAEQFEALTCGLFADWSREDWANVVVAGGAVLLCALPLPHDFRVLRGKKSGSGGGGFDFDFRDEHRLRRDVNDPSLQQEIREDRGGDGPRIKYIQERRWPSADVDVFFHGLDREDAHAKLVHLLKKLRRTVKMKAGVEHDVVFIKTPNTVTVESGRPRRKIQFITRLYSTADEVLNGFDIDCCCLGYDGLDVTLTERCVEALRTRVNTVNLDIRGECYEMRLLKYAERGFAICVPGLDRNALDRDWFRIELVKCAWGDYETTTSRDFAKWAQAENLERLLVAEAISRETGGWLDDTFAGRRRKMGAGASVIHEFTYHITPNVLAANVVDNYGSMGNTRDGGKVYPATTQLGVLEQAHAIGEDDPVRIGKGRVERTKRAWGSICWPEGNMVRKPLTFAAWAASSLAGVKHAPLSWEEERTARLEAKAKKEKEESSRK